MKYRELNNANLDEAIALYIEYYNKHEEGSWTYETAHTRICQVAKMQGSFCLVLEKDMQIIGFSMGYFEQFDDLVAYNLSEIIIRKEYQGRGIGTMFMREIEERVRKKGAKLLQMNAVNDMQHDSFYGKLGYRNASNFVIKSKML